MKALRRLFPNIIILAIIAFAVSGCVSTGGVGIADPRLDAPIGSDDLTAACAEREQKGILLATGAFIADIALSPIAAATAGTALENPMTRAYSARCAENDRAKESIIKRGWKVWQSGKHRE